MLFLRNLRVKNFMGFRGFHDFSFKKGFNVVEGAVGSGKTGLCRAIEFALFGAAWGLGGAEDQSLVNVEYVEECPGRRYYGCEVKLVFEYDGVKFRVERGFMETDYDMVSEDVRYSRGIRPRLSRDLFHDLIYLNEGTLDSVHDGGASQVERLGDCLRQRVRRSVEGGIGLLVLDGAFTGLSPELKTVLLKDLVDSGVGQVLIFEPPGTLEGCFEGCEPQTFLLGETLRSVRVRLHDFPFSPEALLERCEGLFSGSYVFRGDKYAHYVYDRDFLIEVSDVDSNGGRFVSGKTEIHFE